MRYVQLACSLCNPNLVGQLQRLSLPLNSVAPLDALHCATHTLIRSSARTRDPSGALGKISASRTLRVERHVARVTKPRKQSSYKLNRLWTIKTDRRTCHYTGVNDSELPPPRELEVPRWRRQRSLLYPSPEGGVVAPGVTDPSLADTTEAGWTTKTPGHEGSTRQKTRDEDASPRDRYGNKGKGPRSKGAKQQQRTAKTSYPLKRTRDQGENGDGRASFYKLQELLRSEAPPEYIFQMVVRIHDLAQQRRLEEFETRLNAVKDEEERAKLHANWTDSLPAKTLERVGRFADRWDYTLRDDKLRLARTVYSWLVQDKISKKELEQRVQVFTFANKPEQQAYMPAKSNAQPRSYKDVLESKMPAFSTPQPGVSANMNNLLQVAARPAAPLMKPRAMTSDEQEVLDLILSGEMEIKSTPPFLAQVFDSDKVALITELIQRQEYPLHAHLLPGHFVREGLSQNTLLQLVDAGEAGLPEQQNQVQRLKTDLVRLQLDSEQRLLTMFFRSARIAKQWTGSFCPFDRRGMQLIDYRALRQELPDAVLRIDTYRVSILLLRGKISPTEMHALLTKELQLQIAVLNHPTLCEQPGRERWEVIIKSPTCPDVLKRYSRIQLPHAELLIHHLDVHLHLPCTKCRDRWHSHAHCKTAEVDRAQAAAERTLKFPSWSHTFPVAHDKADSLENIRSLDQPLQLFDRMNETYPPRTAAESPVTTFSPACVHSTSAKSKPKVEGKHADCANDIDMEVDSIYLEEKSAAPPTGNEASSVVPGTEASISDPVSPHASPQTAPTGEEAPAVSPPKLSPLKRARANTVVSEEVVNQSEGPESGCTDATADRDSPREASPTQQRSARREVKILRQGSNTNSCSVALPAANSKPVKKATKQLSLYDTLRVEARTISTEPVAGPLQVEDVKVSSSIANVDQAHVSPRKDVLPISWAEVLPAAESSAEADFSDVDMAEVVTSGTEAAQHQPTTATEDALHEAINDEDVIFTGVKPTEMHYHLQLWLEALGGTITDVEANGQCGWSALFAAMHNIHEDFLQLTSKQVVEATLMKKKILNILLAKLQYLVDSRAIDIKTEPGAVYLGAQEIAKEPTTENLALYWDAERRRNVDVPVPRNCWVSHTVLKGAALFLREPIYVIDVHETGRAYLGMYSYKPKPDEKGNSAEFPYFQNLNAGNPVQMLKDLRSAQVQPVVMVLKREGDTKHFQAVAYPDSAAEGLYDPKSYDLMAGRHDDILQSYGLTRPPRGNTDIRSITLAANRAVRKAHKSIACVNAQNNEDKGSEKAGSTGNVNEDLSAASLNL